MDISGFGTFLFESYGGLACLVGGGLLLSFVLAFFLEKKTRKVYKDRGPSNSDSSFFDDDEDEEGSEEEK